MGLTDVELGVLADTINMKGIRLAGAPLYLDMQVRRRQPDCTNISRLHVGLHRIGTLNQPRQALRSYPFGLSHFAESAR